MNDLDLWFWEKRLPEIALNLEKNRFKTYISANEADTVKILFSLIQEGNSIGLGGSVTLAQLNIVEILKKKNFNIINPPDKTLPYEKVIEQRRQSLLSDVFISSANAITENGFVVNLDGISNRTAALLFGPKKVIIIAGINKIVKDTEAAIDRIKRYAAPINAKRLNRATPCAETGVCGDCKTDVRVCCNTVIQGFQNTHGRTNIILIKKSFGI